MRYRKSVRLREVSCSLLDLAEKKNGILTFVLPELQGESQDGRRRFWVVRTVQLSASQ